MAEPKTKATTASVAGYIKKIPEAARRDDCTALVKLFESVTRADAVMWGTDIVGFGTYTMTYADGRKLDWPLTGFSPRKTSLVLYIPGLSHLRRGDQEGRQVQGERRLPSYQEARRCGLEAAQDAGSRFGKGKESEDQVAE